jgi:glutaredoxin-related protein
MSLDIVELFLDEEDIDTGIDAISIVESPAIEEDFVALKSQEFKFEKIDEEKRILLGALLVPNKPIYRKDEDGTEYYIFFSKDTVNKAAQMFLKNGKQGNSTLEHQNKIFGLSLVESWIVEDEVKDKSRLYNMSVPVGTWMGAVKVDNEDIWQDYVKTGKVKGFSIEGFFADKAQNKNPNGLANLAAEDVRENADCPDGYEHKMADGSYMCGKEHPSEEEVALSTLEELFRQINEFKFKKPCWEGYEQIGMKPLKGKEVPNCVPIKRK